MSLPIAKPPRPVVTATAIAERAVPTVLPSDATPPPREPATPEANLALRFVWGVGSLVDWLFGFAVLMVGLAALAAIPVLNFLSLGYLLEAGARVARSGRLRDGFIGVRLASRLGGVVVACWLFILPLRFVSDFAESAAIIDPGSRTATLWRIGLLVLTGLVALHLMLALAMGGRLRHFVSPFNILWVTLRIARGGYYTQARDAVWDTVMALRLPYYFWLGFRGFAAAFAWIAIPVSLIALSRTGSPLATFIGFVGGFLLMLVMLYLPFLQMHMAATNRFAAAFNVLAVRRLYRRAPIAFTFAFFVTLLFALPLYLLKIEAAPREAAWLPGLVFIAFIFPARLLVGWAMGRAAKRSEPRHWFWRWTARLPLLPVALAYVVIVFFTQYTSWNGVWSLYEQHAFLLPVPFFGM